jgi:hypothetical protein
MIPGTFINYAFCWRGCPAFSGIRNFLKNCKGLQHKMNCCLQGDQAGIFIISETQQFFVADKP